MRAILDILNLLGLFIKGMINSIKYNWEGRKLQIEIDFVKDGV